VSALHDPRDVGETIALARSTLQRSQEVLMPARHTLAASRQTLVERRALAGHQRTGTVSRDRRTWVHPP
jgi:hypothetical protein